MHRHRNESEEYVARYHEKGEHSQFYTCCLRSRALELICDTMSDDEQSFQYSRPPGKAGRVGMRCMEVCWGELRCIEVYRGVCRVAERVSTKLILNRDWKSRVWCLFRFKTSIFSIWINNPFFMKKGLFLISPKGIARDYDPDSENTIRVIIPRDLLRENEK